MVWRCHMEKWFFSEEPSSCRFRDIYLSNSYFPFLYRSFHNKLSGTAADGAVVCHRQRGGSRDHGHFCFRHLQLKGPVWLKLTLDAVLSIVVTVNGVVLATASYPHLEFLYFPAAALLALGLASGSVQALVWGAILSAAVREDAGLHIAAPFLLALVYKWSVDSRFSMEFWRKAGALPMRYFWLLCALPVGLALISIIVPGLFVNRTPLLFDEYF
jgi:hypothetical protein